MGSQIGVWNLISGLVISLSSFWAVSIQVCDRGRGGWGIMISSDCHHHEQKLEYMA